MAAANYFVGFDRNAHSLFIKKFSGMVMTSTSSVASQKGTSIATKRAFAQGEITSPVSA